MLRHCKLTDEFIVNMRKYSFLSELPWSVREISITVLPTKVDQTWLTHPITSFLFE